jgi:hypothetical protein
VFKPVASIGLAKDGGIFVAPVPVLDHAWNYGVMRHDPPRAGDIVRTPERPKLHYHRSGVVSATLTGTDLEHRSLRLPPLHELTGAQVLSITSVRPRQLDSAAGDRKGDVLNVVRSWPQSVGFSLSVVVTPDDAPDLQSVPDLAPLGLVRGDPSAFTVSLVAYGLRALLVVRSGTGYTIDPGLHPGISITAMRWNGQGPESVGQMFSLWSASLPNPHVLYERRVSLPRPDDSELVIRHRPRRPLN